MKKLPDKYTSYYDIDETLVHIIYGDTSEEEGTLLLDWYGAVKVKPINSNINALKQDKSAGHNIVVWHRGSSSWAEKVVKALKLEKYVDIILPKPDSYVDDQEASEFMINREYWKDEE